jgi:dihydrolipoamide dehydrogenase
MQKTDLIIIGSGPGGYRAAEYAAGKGLQVVVFEGGALGGTCLNEGCIPTKTLAHNAEVLLTLAEANELGIENLQFGFSYSKVLARKQQVVETLANGVATLLSQPGITLVRERACFVSDKVVKAEVSGEEYEAANIIIATGSESKLPPHCNIDEGAVVDAASLLSIESLPQHLCIVGAGVIGMEFASIFNAFGCKVTVVEFLKECLPAVDDDIAKRLRKSVEKRGVEFFMQSAVKSVTNAANGMKCVTFERKGKEAVVEADVVLMAVGRKPRVAVVEGTAIECDERRGIVVDEHFETSVKGVYAIGDCNGIQMLAHAATMQGIHVVNRILGIADSIRFDIMPAAVFTHPEVACVGATEQQLKDSATAYKALKGYYRANGKALAMNASEGVVKLLVDDSSEGNILGCHIMGAHAADLVQEITALMNCRATLADIHDIIHIHPTLGEVVGSLSHPQ